MAYPCRFVELQGEILAQRGALSSLFLAVTDWMYDKWTLPLLNSGMTKWRHRAQLYADAIDWQTSANQVEWETSSVSSTGPRAGSLGLHTAKKRCTTDIISSMHWRTWASIIGPYGMILWSAEPESGRRNDNFLVNINNLIRSPNGLAYDSVMERLHRVTGKRFQYYGDSARTSQKKRVKFEIVCALRVKLF